MMREDDMLRLSLHCAGLAVSGEPYEQALADGVAAILRTDAGTGVTNCAGPNRAAWAPFAVAISGVPPMTQAELVAVVSVSNRHPSFAGMSRPGATHRVSDLVSLPQFWDTDVWRMTHGCIDGRYPAAAMLSLTRTAVVFVGEHRARQDFDADDMAILNLVRHPLAPALAFRAAWQDAIERCEGPAHARDPLTRREEQVLGLVALGWTNARIGRLLKITERTVRKHLENVNDKLGTPNRAAAVHRWHDRAALRVGVRPAPPERVETTSQLASGPPAQ